jgi:hypothetical protein
MQDALLRLLTEIGPMTAAEMVPLTGWKRDAIKSAVSRLRKANVVRIKSYQRQENGKSGQMAPVYHIGSYADAHRPEPVTNKEASKTYYHRHKVAISVKRFPEHNKVGGVWAGLM